MVDGLDEAAVEAFEELVGEDLGGDGLPVDEVSDRLEATTLLGNRRADFSQIAGSWDAGTGIGAILQGQ